MAMQLFLHQVVLFLLFYSSGQTNSQHQRLADKIASRCSQSKCVRNQMIYTLPLERISGTINRYSLGRPIINPLAASSTERKTILLMGATGSGKTTWINSMVNYVLGVRWDDPFRFMLTDEALRGGSGAHSQTEKVCVYHIHHESGFRIPFSLTIVDTPGFGDTTGRQRDEEITADITNLFKDENGIQELDAVGFVVQSPLVRLTDSHNYVFHSVLSIFGKDVQENIRFLVTFADRNRPIVLDAIKEAKIPCRMDLDGWPCHQKFNNDAIFPCCLPVAGDEDDDEDDRDWKRGTRNFKLFFGQLADMPTKSLQMTRQVTEYRKQLEMKLQWMMSAIPSHLTTMEELREKEKFIELHRSEVDANRNFEIKVPVSRKVQVGVDWMSAVNCTKCETTCHHPCNPALPMGWCPAFAPPPEAGFWANFADKFMNTFREAGCKVCPGQCSSWDHRNEQHRWVYQQVEETQTLEDVRRKYETAREKKMDAEALLSALRRDADQLKEKIIGEMGIIRDLLKSLRYNGLVYGNPVTTRDYVEKMIETERDERKMGFEERIKSLLELLELA